MHISQLVALIERESLRFENKVKILDLRGEPRVNRARSTRIETYVCVHTHISQLVALTKRKSLRGWKISGQILGVCVRSSRQFEVVLVLTSYWLMGRSHMGDRLWEIGGLLDRKRSNRQSQIWKLKARIGS